MNNLIFLNVSDRPLPEVAPGLVFSRQFGGSWKVRWADGGQAAAPCLLVGGAAYPLERDDEGAYHLPRPLPSRVVSGAAGMYRFARLDPAGPVALTPELLIEAAHLSAGEYRTVIDALQDLALKIGSAATVGRLGRQQLVTRRNTGRSTASQPTPGPIRPSSTWPWPPWCAGSGRSSSGGRRRASAWRSAPWVLTSSSAPCAPSGRRS